MPVDFPPSPLKETLLHLLAPIETLPSLQKNHAKLLCKIAEGGRIIDLLFTLPERYQDRRNLLTLDKIKKLQTGDVLTARCKIAHIRRPQTSSQPTILTAQDEKGEIDILFFQKGRLFLPQIGEEILISGKNGPPQHRPTLSRPDHLILWNKKHLFPWIEPIYPLTAGLFPSIIRRALKQAFLLLKEFPEWHVPLLMERANWSSFTQSLKDIHYPERHLPNFETEKEAFLSYNPYNLIEKSRTRLASDEILANQLCLALAKYHSKKRKGRALKGDYHLRREFLHNFGHEPTESQKKALKEIEADMETPTPMTRLLQGDVGAGKTFVAIMALLHAVEAGGQAAMMAPTEILAQQHFETLQKLSSVPSLFLSGSIKGKKRTEALKKIQEGSVKIIIGTHAIFQENVLYHNLAFAIIDEQHRFGVTQRMKLSAKGEMTDLLIMTATPIPRTLQLTQWGEMGVSRLEGKPKGRKPIKTTIHDIAMIGEIFTAISRALQKGQQIFWVCPLVENSETQSAIAAEERWASLKEAFGDLVGLAHGKQDITTRQEALTLFKEGTTKILVATTVIEVGVDIPQATIMIIEEAERFGLAQLHQLRGRVGRGSERSYCLLLHRPTISPLGKLRLALLKETEDGFLIADEDLRLRGAGSLAGTKQSGFTDFRFTLPQDPTKILTFMTKDAQYALSKDSHLTSQRGASLRALLALFERHEPEKLLISG